MAIWWSSGRSVARGIRDIDFDAAERSRRLIDGCPDIPRCIEKKTGKHGCDTTLGVTSRTPQEASPQRVLAVNRGHWSIESVHYLIDWNYAEGRSRIRTGFGPENITRLRRFAVGVLKSFQTRAQSIAQMMRTLSFRTRLVFDYLRMTNNALTGIRVP